MLSSYVISLLCTVAAICVLPGAVSLPNNQRTFAKTYVRRSFGGTFSSQNSANSRRPDRSFMKTRAFEVDDSADFCPKMVTLLAEASQAEEFLADTLDMFGADSICGLFADGDSAKMKECREMETKRDTIIKLLASGETPESVCDALRVKKSNKQKNVGLPDMCDLCQEAADFIQEMQDAGIISGDVLEKGTRKLCDAITRHELPDVCDELVGSVSDLDKCLKSGKTTHECCEEVGLCAIAKNREEPTSAKKHVVVEEITADEPSCDFCIQATGIIESAIHYNNDSIEMVKDGLKILCNNLPESTHCNVIIKRFDEIADAIEKDMNPRLICQVIGLCPSSETIISHNNVEVENVNEVNELEGGQSIPCVVCNEVGQVVDSLLQFDEDLIPVLKQELAQVCDAIPFDLPCDKIPEQIDQMVAMLKKGDDVETACEALKYCKAGTRLENVDALFSSVLAKYSKLFQSKALDSFNELSNVDAPIPPIIYSCTLCQFVGVAITTINQHNKELVPIFKQELGALCAFLPAKSKCDDIVKNFDDIANAMSAGSNPFEACSKVKLCPAENENDQLKKALRLMNLISLQ